RHPSRPPPPSRYPPRQSPAQARAKHNSRWGIEHRPALVTNPPVPPSSGTTALPPAENIREPWLLPEPLQHAPTDTRGCCEPLLQFVIRDHARELLPWSSEKSGGYKAVEIALRKQIRVLQDIAPGQRFRL